VKIVSSIILVSMAVIALATACHAVPSPTDYANVNADLNQQMACVDAGGTRAQIDACRNTVKCSHGDIACTSDSGTSSASKDGGT
jgi:hypothetical protein